MKLQHSLLRPLAPTVGCGALLLAALAGTTQQAPAQITRPALTPTPKPAQTPVPGNTVPGNTGIIVVPGTNVIPGVGYGDGTIIGGTGGTVGSAKPGSATFPNGNAGGTSAPTGKLTGRPIRVRSFPTQPAGTQRLLNNTNLPIFTGIVQTMTKTGFTLLVGKALVNVTNARKPPTTLSHGDLVQVQGLRKGNNVRSGSVSILRDR